jgi:hypothetical protein
MGFAEARFVAAIEHRSQAVDRPATVTIAYLPQALGGCIPALLVQAALLLGLYTLADW